MRMLLLRHGQTSSNVGGKLDTGSPGADLTDLGREQADALVDALADEPVKAVYASPLARARQTAAPLAAARGLELQVRAGVREIRAGDLEMRSDDGSVRAYLETVLAWTRGDLGTRQGGAETGAEVLARFDAVVEEILGLGVDSAVVVSHGAMIRCWTACRALDVGTDWVARHPLGNTGVVTLEGDGRAGWRVLDWEGHAVSAEDVAAPDQEGPAAEPLA